MITTDLSMRAAERLELLLKTYRFITVSELAGRIGVEPRTLLNWRRAGLSVEKARIVARTCGITADYFLDDALIFEDHGPSYYLRPTHSKETKEARVIFDGRATLMMTSFLETNRQQLAQTRVLRLETFEDGCIDVQGSDVDAVVNGYQRSVVVDETMQIGGVNAIAEDCRLKSLEIIGLNDVELMMPGGRFKFIDSSQLAQHAANGLDVLIAGKMLPEVLHLCARLPNEQTFSTFLGAIKDLRADDFELFEFAFDASKRFEAYFAQNRTDALIFEAFLCDFIRRHIKAAEAANAVTYAIEALPFCTYFDRFASERMFDFLQRLHLRSGSFRKANRDMRVAAAAALDFLPFVAQPEGFSLWPVQDAS